MDPLKWFLLFWLIGLVSLSLLHVRAYGRVATQAITSAIPHTTIGAVVSVVVTSVIVWSVGVKHPVLLFLLVAAGVICAMRISVSRWERPLRRSVATADPGDDMPVVPPPPPDYVQSSPPVKIDPPQ